MAELSMVVFSARALRLADATPLRQSARPSASPCSEVAQKLVDVRPLELSRLVRQAQALDCPHEELERLGVGAERFWRLALSIS